MVAWFMDIPLFWAKILGTIFFVSVIIWALMRPKEYIFRGAPDRKRWRDLRIWAAVILVVQIILYIKY
ncbi:MAG: hypothetical protein KAY24_10320 [Candidatus Eisenbacteria sp.]|nr:hypothetical protein [Candidatus Eisenbacteria bacterium]